jgi:hypothetical protein
MTGEATLVLGRGVAFRRTAVAFATFTGGVVYVILLFLMEPGPRGTGAWILLVALLALALSAFPLLLRLRAPLALEADDLGIRMRRGSPVVKELPWGRVARVSKGSTSVVLYRYAQREGYGLRIRGKGLVTSISVDDVNYKVPSGELSAFAGRVSEMAQARSIPGPPPRFRGGPTHLSKRGRAPPRGGRGGDDEGAG